MPSKNHVASSSPGLRVSTGTHVIPEFDDITSSPVRRK